MNKLEKAAAFGAMMGKVAGNQAFELYKKQQAERSGAVPAASAPAAKPRYSLRNDPDFKEYFEDQAEEKANMNNLQNATGNAGNGSYQGTIQGGKVKPGATFTPNAGQQGQKPLPSVGGKQKMPPAPMGQRQTPKAMPTNKTIPNRRVILD
jgi:hypothetical protein